MEITVEIPGALAAIWISDALGLHVLKGRQIIVCDAVGDEVMEAGRRRALFPQPCQSSD
jgi:hypothetical protein